MKPPAERFEGWVSPEPNSGCWLWTSALTRDGYGQFMTDHSVLAHRWSYEHYVGPIPAGLQLDHLCRVRSCVNPRHLEPVTNRENCYRGLKGPTATCARGHSVWILRRDAGRRCLICRKAKDQASRLRAKARQQVISASMRQFQCAEPLKCQCSNGDGGVCATTAYCLREKGHAGWHRWTRWHECWHGHDAWCRMALLTTPTGASVGRRPEVLP
jgi:hypothetical protein